MTTNDVSWRPLLAGEAAREAVAAIEEIAGALKDEIAAGGSADPRNGGASLAGGSAGIALFFDYAAQALPAREEEYAELAARYLDRAIEAVAAEPMSFGLHSGFTGIAWVAEHLQGRAAAGSTAVAAERAPAEPAETAEPAATAELPEAAGEEDGDLNAEIDAALADLLARQPWRETYDLIGGLVGLGAYALERLPRESAAACLAAVVDRLDELSESSPEGVTWFSPPEHIGPWGRTLSPEGNYNLGVAHGVPGVFPLLAAACRAGVRAERAAALLEGGVRWFLAQQDRTGAISCFANIVQAGLEPAPARLAWCYGDGGIAAALLAAARLMGRADWEQDALAIARRAAARPVGQSGVRDAGLCHGAFGLAHIFNRIHQATGDDLFAETARLWYREGLALRRPGEGVAGFSAWDSRDGEASWRPDGGFLTGAAGIGLALVAAVAPHEPAWDRVLMVDVPLVPMAPIAPPGRG